MEVQLAKGASSFLRRRRKWLILVAAFGVSGYGAFKVYHLPSVARKRKRFVKLFGAIFSVAELVSESAETISLLSRDLNDFLKSDSDEIPNSLKQVSKIAMSRYFTGSLARASEALTIGIHRGYDSESINVGSSRTGSPSDLSFTDKIMDRVFSKAGSGFVSVVVGSFARNLVLGLYSDEQASGLHCGSSSSDAPRWVNFLCNEIKCKELIGDCIQKFVSTAVAVYLDKTMNINTYDEIFAGLTNPNHRDRVRDVLVAVCNGAVETLVKTSHQVMTSSKPNNNTDAGFMDDDSLEKNVFSDPTKERNSVGRVESNGWVRVLSKTLAVPSNRKLVFDVTGRVTLETTRSVMEFLLWKILEGFRQSFNVVQDEVVNRGCQVMGYVGARSSVIVTVCLALYLHVLTGNTVLLPA